MTSTVFDSLSPSSADSPSPLSRRGVIDEEEQLLAQLQRLQEQYAALRGGGVGSHFSLGAGGEEPSIPPKRVIVVSYDLPVSLPSSRKILGQETTSYEASPRPKQLSVQEQQLFAETNWIPDEKKSRTANAKPQPVLREEYSALCKHLEKSNLFDFVWIGGLNVQNLEVSHLQSVQKELMDLYNCIPVFAYGETFDRHYNGFCKSVLWPILHSIPPSKIYYNGDGSRNSHVESESVDIFWKSFLEVNEAFAQQIIQVYNPETDVIWVQDYHLCILPFILRQRVPDATIGFFLHTPFSSSEIFRILPYRKQILQGILSSDLIGVQTSSYARHLIASFSRILGLESTPNGIECDDGHFAHLRICPLGIDIEQVDELLSSYMVQNRRDDLLKQYGDKIVIVGVDEMDFTKGIVHKLSAFEVFLQKWPQYRDKVVLVQIALPVRSDSESYQSLKAQVNEQVGRINAEYGRVDSLPIHYINRKIDKTALLAILSVSHIALITSLKDGMNLIPFQFIVSQRQNPTPGVLILSEFAGSSEALRDAMIINPWGTDQVAEAIYTAINMSEDEKIQCFNTLYRHISTYTQESWATNFLYSLSTIDDKRRSSAKKGSSPLDTLALQSSYLQSKRRLIVLDYDGTLVPHQSRPELAKLSSKQHEYLERLCADPHNTVLVVSGRTKQNMEDWFEGLPCALAAEHGCFLREAPGDEWQVLVPNLDMEWRDAVHQIMEYYTERTPGSFLEVKETALTWHFFDADPEFGQFQARELQNHLTSVMTTPHTVLVNVSKTVEARPESSNKKHLLRKFCRGRVLRREKSAYDEGRVFDFILCIGDDRSDAPMFEYLNRLRSATYVFTVIVQDKENSSAKHYLNNSNQLETSLQLLADLSSQTSSE